MYAPSSHACQMDLTSGYSPRLPGAYEDQRVDGFTTLSRMYCQVQSLVVKMGYAEEEKAVAGGRIKSCGVQTG